MACVPCQWHFTRLDFLFQRFDSGVYLLFAVVLLLSSVLVHSNKLDVRVLPFLVSFLSYFCFDASVVSLDKSLLFCLIVYTFAPVA